MLTILVDGIAYGMLLFVMAVGLSVTLGLMNFVNLAHGALAMIGGYTAALMMNKLGWPFLATLPAAFLVPAFIGALLERTLYVHMYARSHLDQVLFTIALVFMSMVGADWLMGTDQVLIQLPDWLQGRFDLLGIGVGRYRAFLILFCTCLVVAIHLILSRSVYGAQLRAAVDDRRTAQALGIQVSLLFAATFAIGSGLAGLGGALAIDLMGLSPMFPLQTLIYVMIVVTIGGTAGIAGPFAAALIIGVGDTMGRYLVPELGSVMIYLLMILLLCLRPNGIFKGARI